MADWRYIATRCAVEGCERTRVKGWSTCRMATHYSLGRSLYGAGAIQPIPAPPIRLPYLGVSDEQLRRYADSGSLNAMQELERRELSK